MSGKAKQKYYGNGIMVLSLIKTGPLEKKIKEKCV